MPIADSSCALSLYLSLFRLYLFLIPWFLSLYQLSSNRYSKARTVHTRPEMIPRIITGHMRQEKFLPRDRDVSLGKIPPLKHQRRISKKANLSRALIACDRTHEPRGIGRNWTTRAANFLRFPPIMWAAAEPSVETSELGKSPAKIQEATAVNGSSRAS